MVRNVKVLEGKQYTTRKIRKVIIDEEESESMEDKNIVLKEKNRQSAQRSRDNKKKFILDLELRVAELEAENNELRHKLSNCHCHHKLEDAKHNQFANHAGNVLEMNIENAQQNNDQTESGGDTFQRLSVRSFVSCSNFLMLALIAVCCVCGFLEHNGQASIYRRLLYSQQNLKHIIQKAKYKNCDEPHTLGKITGRPNCLPTHKQRWSTSRSDQLPEINETLSNQQTKEMRKL